MDEGSVGTIVMFQWNLWVHHSIRNTLIRVPPSPPTPHVNTTKQLNWMFLLSRRWSGWRLSARSCMSLRTLESDLKLRRLWWLSRTLRTVSVCWVHMDGLLALLWFSAGKCQRLLERANSPYSQLLATTPITKLITDPGRLAISCLKIRTLGNPVYPFLFCIIS